MFRPSAHRALAQRVEKQASHVMQQLALGPAAQRGGRFPLEVRCMSRGSWAVLRAGSWAPEVPRSAHARSQCALKA